MHPNTQTTKNLKIKKSSYFEVLLIKDIEEKKIQTRGKTVRNFLYNFFFFLQGKLRFFFFFFFPFFVDMGVEKFSSN